MNRTLELQKNKKLEGQVLLTSCDSVYFNTYAPALFQSAVVANTAIHFNVVNPSSMAAETMLRFGNHPSDANNKVSVSFTYVELQEVDEKVYYCCDRFALARDLIALNKDLTVLTIDVDSLIMKPLPDLTKIDLGLWLRPTGPAGMNLLAGMCMFSDKSLDFIDEACTRMETAGFKTWFDDQRALWDTFKGYTKSGIFFQDFAQTHPPLLDWTFTDDSHIWTGKGPRKHVNKKYVAKFNEFTDQFLRS